MRNLQKKIKDLIILIINLIPVAIIYSCFRLYIMMIQELSILIPVYNDNATMLVKSLSKQAQAISGLCYEIVVFDDGSIDVTSVEINKSLTLLPHCRYVYAEHHDCRAAMRNDMFRHAKYDWHLMIDARLTLMNEDFLMRYLCCGAQIGEVACGGVCVDGGSLTAQLYRENLRFRYEKHEESKHSCPERKAEPYKAFRTTNFFYHKSVLLQVPYNEQVSGYGYEDVLLGKALREKKIKVNHIDNPVAYTEFEKNQVYLRKIEEALRTLHAFEGELDDYSPLLHARNILRKFHLLGAFRKFHALYKGWELMNLCSNMPSLFIFKLYKLGYYVSL